MKRKKHPLLSLSLGSLLALSTFLAYPIPSARAAVNLSGNLSGAYNYPGQDVIIGDVNVVSYDGSSSGYFEVNALNITVTGTINATGAGYGGGGGGGGGATGGPWPYSPPIYRNGGAGGTGVGGGQNGVTPAPYYSADSGSSGGAGGKGGGTYGGAGGSAGVGGTGGNGGDGSRGGYAGNGTNGDSSTNESVLMGSGGGAGGGGGAGRSDSDCYGGSYGETGGGGGGGAGAGNRGGGIVKLVATGTLVVSGRINSLGLISSSGNGASGTQGYNHANRYNTSQGIGGAGGPASSSGTSVGAAGSSRTSGYRGNMSWGSCVAVWGQARNGGAGGTGGAGAGGGILLKGSTVNLSGGTFDNRGGGSSYTNGGTLKVFYSSSYTPGNYYVGRLYVGNYNTAPTAQITAPANGYTVGSSQAVNFSGTGTDTDGTIAEHGWYDGGCGLNQIDPALYSNIGLGTSSSTSTFSKTFSAGTHTIYYRVRDNGNAWSNCDANNTITLNVEGQCASILGDVEWCSGDTTGLSASDDGQKYLVGGPTECTAPRKCEYYEKASGECGEATSEAHCTSPAYGSLCTKGTPTNVEVDNGNKWKWICEGVNSGVNKTCHALKSCAFREVNPN